MPVKALNFKLDEMQIDEIKYVASVYHMTVTELIKEALDDYLDKMKTDPFYKLSANIAEAEAAESAEILESINSLKDDDLAITSGEKITV